MSDRPSLHTLVVVPTYNELENLPVILGRLQQARPDVHVLVVDDGSPDGTGKLADELAAADPERIHVMHRTAKAGLGAAYLAGFAWGWLATTRWWSRWTPTAAMRPSSCTGCWKRSTPEPT